VPLGLFVIRMRSLTAPRETGASELTPSMPKLVPARQNKEPLQGRGSRGGEEGEELGLGKRPLLVEAGPVLGAELQRPRHAYGEDDECNEHALSIGAGDLSLYA